MTLATEGTENFVVYFREFRVFSGYIERCSIGGGTAGSLTGVIGLAPRIRLF